MSAKSEIMVRRVGELVTAVGVILGLLFVGVEIRQNTATAQAQSRQELAAQNIDFLMRIVEDESLSELWAQEWTEEYISGLTLTERSRVFQTTIALMIRLENVYLQHRVGLVEEEALSNYGMDQGRFDDPGFWILWDMVSDTFEPAFVEYFQELNSRIP